MASYVTIRDEVDVWPTNWKLLVENFMDPYHVFKVHKQSFGADGDNTLDTTVFPGTLDWTHHLVTHDAGPDLAAATNKGLKGSWRKTIVLGAVFPGFVMQLQPDWLWFLRITPVGTGHVRIAWQIAVAPETLDTVDDRDAYIVRLSALVDKVNSEDIPIVSGVRREPRSTTVPTGPALIPRTQRVRLRSLHRNPSHQLSATVPGTIALTNVRGTTVVG